MSKIVGSSEPLYCYICDSPLTSGCSYHYADMYPEASLSYKKVGVAISSTPDRKDILEAVLSYWNEYLPGGAVLWVTTDIGGAGVANIKNAGLAYLERQGVTDYFLSDDDTWPISPDWWKPFVESSEPHLLYNFPLKNKGKNDMQELYRDDKIVSYSHTRGCLIYVTQKVLDTVGGFDTRYVNSFEHPDYTNRIHNAGLTTHRSMSPVNAHELFYCLDQDGKIESSIKKDLVQNMKNYRLYKENRQSKTYMEYK